MKRAIRGLRMTALSAFACTLVVAVCAGASGCIVEEHRSPPPPPLDTQIELDEQQNIGSCGDASQFSWRVSNRETSADGTACCGQPVLFTHLTPDATYTFDIVGYQGDRVCWQGSCTVDARYGTLTYGDCSAQIEHLCGL